MTAGERVIGHGIDLVEIDRIADMLERHGARFVERCFTGEEQAWAEAAHRRRAERYAARFACKEAVLKAIGTGLRDGIRWTDIGVVNEPSGRPIVRLTGRCQEIARAQGCERWHVSLTHAGPFARVGRGGAGGRGPDSGAGGGGGYAVASVVAVGRVPGPT